mmetsp:Transcript_20413/g.27710  ORF Transcript_20413/g.27710 Transcript_20413/m.27710 type:complete len:93 (+) Transcript_20413:250-528(+)
MGAGDVADAPPGPKDAPAFGANAPKPIAAPATASTERRCIGGRGALHPGDIMSPLAGDVGSWLLLSSDEASRRLMVPCRNVVRAQIRPAGMT